MTQIIEFRKREKVTNRVEALVKGKIEEFTCDSCGADIEVIDGQYPDKCPGCGLSIVGWNKTEECT